MIVLGVFREELWLQRLGKIVPIIGAEHGAIHLVVQFPQTLDRCSSYGLVVEMIVGLGHPLIGVNHQLGAVIVISLADRFEHALY